MSPISEAEIKKTNQQLEELVRKWHQDTEASAVFKGESMAEKNRMRREYHDRYLAPLARSPLEAEQLKSFYKTSFWRSMVWGVVESVAPWIKRPPEAIVEHPMGALIGHTAGMLPQYIGAFKAVGAIPALTKIPKLAGRAIRGGLAFAAPEVPQAAAKRVPWAEVPKAAAIGAAGMGPHTPILKGLLGGTVSAAVAGPKGAAFTGIPLLDVGLPMGLMFGLGGKMELRRVSKAKRLSPRQELAAELKDYQPRAAEHPGEVRLPMDASYQDLLAADQARIGREYLLKMQKEAGQALKELKATGNTKMLAEVERSAERLRGAIREGAEADIAQAREGFEAVLDQAQSFTAGLPTTQQVGADSMVTLSTAGLKSLRGPTLGPQTRRAFTMMRDRPIPVSGIQYEKLNVPGNKEALDRYIAREAVGYDRAFTETDLAALGYTKENLHEFIGTLRGSGVLKMTAAGPTIHKGPTARLPAELKSSFTEKIQEIENMPITASEKQVLKDRLEAALGKYRQARGYAARQRVRAKAAEKTGEAFEGELGLDYREIEQKTIANVRAIGLAPAVRTVELEEFFTEGIEVSTKHRSKVIRTIQDVTNKLGREEVASIGKLNVFYVNKDFLKEVGRNPKQYASVSYSPERGDWAMLIRADLPANREVIAHELGHILGRTVESQAETFVSRVYPSSLQAGVARARQESQKILQDYQKLLDDTYQKMILEGKVGRGKVEELGMAPENIRSAGEIGMTPAARPSELDPLGIAELAQKKGISIAWDSRTGGLRVIPPKGKPKKITIAEMEELPSAGDATRQGEIVITTGADEQVLVVKRGGQWLVREKLRAKKGTPRDLSYEELEDILYNKGFILEYKTPDGGLFFRSVKDGTASRVAKDEIKAFMERNPSIDTDLSPSVDIPPNPASFSSQGTGLVPTDATPNIGKASWQATRLFLTKITPTKPVMALHDKLSGKPILQAWRTSEEGVRQIRKWQRNVYPRIKTITKSLDPGKEEGILRYIETREMAVRAKYRKEYGLTRDDLRIAEASEEIFKEAFGPEYQEFLTSHIAEYVATGSAPEALKPFIRNGFVPQHERLTDLLINAVNSKMRMYVRPALEQMIAYVDDLTREGTLTPKTIAKIRGDVKMYHNSVMGTVSSDHATASDFFEVLNKRLNLKMEGDLMRKVVASAMLLSYSGVMPLRFGLMLRNALQTLTTTSLYTGMGNWSRGAKRLLHPDGRGITLARELGYGEFTGIPMEHYLPQGALRKAYNAGMVPYMGVDAFNRALSANIGYAAVERYAPRFLRGRISLEDFKFSTGLGYLEEATQREILAPLAFMKDTKKAVAASAKLMGMNLAEDTQWLYRAGNAPRLFRSKPGRFLGQFGIWPTNFLRFWTRGISTGNAAATERFLLRWLAVNGTILFAGEQVFGVDIRRWLFTGPFNYAGGPGMELVTTALDYQRGGFRREMAIRNFQRMGYSFIPFSMAYRDIKRTLEAESTGEAAKRFLGYRTYPPERRR